MKSLTLLLAVLQVLLVHAAPIHEPCMSGNVTHVKCDDYVPPSMVVREALFPRATIEAARKKEAVRRAGGTTSAVAPKATAEAPASADNGKCAASSTGLNSATVDLIKEFEGLVKAPGPDPIGLPTVGFGHLCQSNGCAEVPFKFPLTESTATQLLKSDANTFVSCLHKMIKPSVILNDNQFGALTSFAFNLGCGTVQTSTMLKRLNAGEDPNMVVAQEIPKFDHAGGKVLAGLTRRRTAEVALFKKASSTIAHPLC